MHSTPPGDRCGVAPGVIGHSPAAHTPGLTPAFATLVRRDGGRRFVSREDIQRVLATCDDVTLDGDSVVYPKQVAVAPTPAAGGGDGGKVAEEADESSFPVTDLVALLESVRVRRRHPRCHTLRLLGGVQPRAHHVLRVVGAVPWPWHRRLATR